MKKIIAMITILAICVGEVMAEEVGLRFCFDAKVGSLWSMFEENEGPSNLDDPMWVGFDGTILKVMSNKGEVFNEEITDVKSLSKLEGGKENERSYSLEYLSDRGAIISVFLKITEKDENSFFFLNLPITDSTGRVLGYWVLSN